MRSVLITFVAFALASACALGVGAVVEPEGGVHAISPDSACPVTGCASGSCHGYGDVPEPDGPHEMTCPEAGCASADCHAWDTLREGYHQASDASLNLWILAPAALVVGLVALVGALSRPGRGEGGEAAAGDGAEAGGGGDRR